MGIIKFFKNLFKPKPIMQPKPKNMDFIQPLSHGFDTIELNQELVVDEEWTAVIVAKGGPQDSFGSGTHKLGLAYMPHTTKTLNLDKGKVVKHGVTAEVVLPQRFKCDLYYVFMGENDKRRWCTEEIKIKSKNTKHMHYYLEGSYTFQVQNAELAVKLFLIDWAKIKTGKAGKKLDYLISEICSNVLWNKKIKDKKPLLEYEFANTVLKPAVNKVMLKYGIVIFDMRLENLVFPDKLKTETFAPVFPEIENNEPKQLEIKEQDKKLLTAEDQQENFELQHLEQKNDKKHEKETKKPRFFKQDVKQSEFKSESDASDISNVVKGSLLEIENEGKTKRKKIPFYSYNGTEKNDLYKTADEISNTCPSCGTVNFEGNTVCKKCGEKLK